MDLYLVGPEKKTILEAIIKRHTTNFLFSYLRKKGAAKWFQAVKPNGKVFIDSGAFTMWTKGITLNVDEYIEWLNANHKAIDLFGQVDCIPGTKFNTPTSAEVQEAAAKTWDNYLYMRSKVINKDALLYTFHFGESIEYLKKALSWKDEKGQAIKYLALGGLVGRTSADRDKFLDLCFSTIKNSSNPNVKVHTFGMTDYKLLEKYPITSADSTSWFLCGGVGCIMLPEGVLKVSGVGRHDKDFYFHRLPKEAIQRIEKNLARYGLTFTQLEASTDYAKLYNACYMQDKADELKQHTFTPTKRLF